MRCLAVVMMSLCVLAVPAHGSRHAGNATALKLNTITGTPGADVLRGTDGADTIRGLAGKDTLHGRGGSDRLDGGDGNDVMFGDAGNDTLLAGGRPGFYEELDGGAGNDLLVSSREGTIRLIGGPGNDVLRGTSGVSAWAADTYSGGPGNDKLLSVDITNATDAFLPSACGRGRDVAELVRVPTAARADVRKTLRTVHGCERVVFR